MIPAEVRLLDVRRNFGALNIPKDISVFYLFVRRRGFSLDSFFRSVRNKCQESITYKSNMVEETFSIFTFVNSEISGYQIVSF